MQKLKGVVSFLGLLCHLKVPLFASFMEDERKQLSLAVFLI